MRFMTIFVMLAVFWAVNSGQLYPFLIGAGVVCCAGTAWLALRMKCLGDDSSPVPFLLGMCRYSPWLLWQVIQSNIDVAKRVWSPRGTIDPRMIKVPCRLRTDWGIATYANSITLTPGTVTVELVGQGEDKAFLIHALTAEAADGVLAGEMERHVAKVEGSA